MQNLKLTSIQNPIYQKLKESNLLESVTIYDGEKAPVFPILGDTTQIMDLPLTEAYNLSEDIIIDKSDVWSEIKNGKPFIDYAAKVINVRHFNKCLQQELDTLSLTPIKGVDEILKLRQLGSNYILCVNEKDFETLLDMKDTTGRKRVINIKGSYYIDSVELAIIPTLTNCYMLDRSEIIARYITNTVEVKDVGTLRAGKYKYNIVAFVGIGFINISNLFKGTL